MTSNDGILSQEEINRLFDEMKEQKKTSSRLKSSKPSVVRTYDFGKTNKISKESARTFQVLNEAFARNAGQAFSTLLGSLITVRFKGLSESGQQDYINDLDEPINLALFTMDPLEGKAAVELGSPLALWLIDRSYGGKGNTVWPDRETTSLEQGLLLRILEGAFKSFRDAWAEIVPGLAVTGDAVEINPKLAQVWMPNETLLIFEFEIEMDSFRDGFRICLPYSMLEPVASKISSNVVMGYRQSKEDGEKIVQHIEGIDMPVHAVLGQVTLKVRDILSLERGDVLMLNTSIHDSVSLKIGKTFKFRGNLGNQNGKWAVQIQERVKER